MTLTAQILRNVRSIALGVLAAGAMLAVLPAPAMADPHPREISRELDRIAYEAYRASRMGNRHRRADAIDRLRDRLRSLERINNRWDGRLPRSNDRRIDHLQRELRAMGGGDNRRRDRREGRWRRGSDDRYYYEYDDGVREGKKGTER